jgi:hypothetical protein
MPTVKRFGSAGPTLGLGAYSRRRTVQCPACSHPSDVTGTLEIRHQLPNARAVREVCNLLEFCLVHPWLFADNRTDTSDDAQIFFRLIDDNEPIGQLGNRLQCGTELCDGRAVLLDRHKRACGVDGVGALNVPVAVLPNRRRDGMTEQGESLARCQDCGCIIITPFRVLNRTTQREVPKGDLFILGSRRCPATGHFGRVARRELLEDAWLVGSGTS